MDKKWLWFLLGIAIPCLLNLINSQVKKSS